MAEQMLTGMAPEWQALSRLAAGRGRLAHMGSRRDL
jgi:hypothetical protein